MRQANGRGTWDRRSVLIVDEAAMISTKHFVGAVDKAASAAGAKVILAGDEQAARQHRARRHVRDALRASMERPSCTVSGA